MASSPLLFVTDLDGSLLDEVTYSCEAARPALTALGERGALLIPHGVLTHRVPGSRRGGGHQLVPLGVPRPVLLAMLSEIAVETRTRIRGFSSLRPREIQSLTGLSRTSVRRARIRHWDEPFPVAPEAASRMAEAARRRGLRVTQGGRFQHLTGPADKGAALRLLLERLAAEGRRYTTIGLGDCGNDLSVLERVDWPILIPRSGGLVDPVLAAALPFAERAPAPGPAGWNAAVLAVLAGAPR